MRKGSVVSQPYRSQYRGRKSWRKTKIALVGLAVVGLGLFAWKESTEGQARWVPDYPKMELSPVEHLGDLSAQEMTQLMAQTGLTEIGLARLEEAGLLERLPGFQLAFFTPAVEIPKKDLGKRLDIGGYPMLCTQNSIMILRDFDIQVRSGLEHQSALAKSTG